MELLRHLLGLCGEHHHPNLFTILALLFGGTEVLYYIKYKIKTKKQDFKTWKQSFKKNVSKFLK